MHTHTHTLTLIHIHTPVTPPLLVAAGVPSQHPQAQQRLGKSVGVFGLQRADPPPCVCICLSSWASCPPTPPSSPDGCPCRRGTRGIPQKQRRGRARRLSRSTRASSEAAPRLVTWSLQASLDSGNRAMLPLDLNVTCVGSGEARPLCWVPNNDSSIPRCPGQGRCGVPRTKATSCSAATGLTPGRRWPPLCPTQVPTGGRRPSNPYLGGHKG